MASTHSARNELDRELSPYLLQHAHQPVHWRAWGEGSLAEARTLDRPIMLSIGYAACHWCHVMAHESFDDDATATILNAHFVSIKVDREERPDIDQLYMAALQAMGEQGGWPLTMFLTPQGEAFWGGTYFPRESRWGRPAFRAVLHAVAEAYRRHDPAVLRNAYRLAEAVRAVAAPFPGSFPDADQLRRVTGRVLALTDRDQGGLRGAPKFPNFPLYRFLAQRAARDDTIAGDAVETLLHALCRGGIRDHVGGGLFRYSTDAVWLVPHFEKMLYDNAQFLEILALAHAARPSAQYREAAVAAVGFMLRDLDAQGCFAASLDADTEAGEGAFYVWTEAEINTVLGSRAAAFRAAFDVTTEGNWEGRTILRRRAETEASAPEHFAADLAALARARASRPPPALDDKVLADWNSLAISALCRASHVFSMPAWRDVAAERFATLATRLRTGGRWHHAWRGGTISAAGLLEDLAAAGGAALTLFESTGENSYLEQAEAVVAEVDAWHGPATQGYVMTAADSRDIPSSLRVRLRSMTCSAVPSGSGLMAQLLARLFHLTGEQAYRDRASQVIEAFAGRYEQPLATPTLLAAAELLEDARVVVVAGEPDLPVARALLDVALAAPDPARCVLRLPPGASLPAHHPAHAKTAPPGLALAYLCRGGTCLPPIGDPEALRQALR